MPEKIEVSLGHPLGVVGWAVRRTIGRANEAAAGREVDLDIRARRLGVEVGSRHDPERPQAETPAASDSCHSWLPARILSVGPVLIHPGAVLAVIKDAPRKRGALRPQGNRLKKGVTNREGAELS